MTYRYEWITTISSMACKKDFESLEKALELATEHVEMREAQPLKILKDDKTVLNSEMILQEIKKRAGA